MYTKQDVIGLCMGAFTQGALWEGSGEEELYSFDNYIKDRQI